MGIVTEVNDLWHLVYPKVKRYLARSPQSTSGLISRTALTKGSRLPGEVFAAELLRRSIRIEKQSENHTVIHIDRGGVTDAVISTEGKRLLCEKFVTPKQKVLRRQDVDCHQFLLDLAARGSKTIEVSELPIRWASGGIVSVVTHKRRKWIPLFFRDIRPYGWNISLGSSERYFDDKGQSMEELDGELDNPTRFIGREFLEETLVLDKAPALGANTSRPFALPFWHGPEADEKQLQFSAEHLTLRRDYDGLRIFPDENQKLRASASPTTMTLQIARDAGRSNSLTDVIVCLNLLELGIEVVKVISYNLNDNDYLLDGEVLEFNPKELTRMPVALISVDYLKSAFGNQQDWIHTAGPQPSVRVIEPLSEDDIRIFDWDIRQRLAIVRGEKEGVGTEFERYLDWYDKFHANFFDQHDQPYTKNPSNLFTPATAKVLSLCFAQIKSKVLQDG